MARQRSRTPILEAKRASAAKRALASESAMKRALASESADEPVQEGPRDGVQEPLSQEDLEVPSPVPRTTAALP